MAFHPEDQAWLLAILDQLAETTCTREGVTKSIEFKENFGFASLPLYARTMAAFANTSGGYLVFGVKDAPRELLGLTNDRFSQIDPAKLSIELNQVVDPALSWRSGILEYESKIIGYIYVAEAQRKPIVCKKSEGSLREGAIYYRYPGMTQEIRFAELLSLLEGIREATEKKWMDLLSRIASVGIDNSAVLNLNSGEVSGPKGAMFIPADLLPRLQFVREGEFVETLGAPALKLIGEAHVAPLPIVPSVESVGVIPQIIQIPTHIDGSDIIRAFLSQQIVTDPKQWLLVICGELSPYYPVHYFRRQSQLSLADTIRLFEESPVRSQGRARLIQRLREGTRFRPGAVSGTGEASLARSEMLKEVINKTLSSTEAAKHFDRFLEAVLHLSPASADLGYVLQLLLGFFPKYASMNGIQANRFRTAIAYLDEAWFGRDGQVAHT